MGFRKNLPARDIRRLLKAGASFFNSNTMKHKTLKKGQLIQFEDNGQICKVVSVDTEGNPTVKDINTGKIIEHVGRLYKIISFAKAVIKLFLRFFG